MTNMPILALISSAYLRVVGATPVEIYANGRAPCGSVALPKLWKFNHAKWPYG